MKGHLAQNFAIKDNVVVGRDIVRCAAPFVFFSLVSSAFMEIKIVMLKVTCLKNSENHICE